MHTYNVYIINEGTVSLLSNPFEVLNLRMPRDPYEGFNHGRVKKEYRALAKRYHPDKVHLLSAQEQLEADDIWLKIQEAYETLTDEAKFADWVDYGSPEAG